MASTPRSFALLVDDHDLIRELTVRLLEGSGLEVVPTGDAEGAIEMATARAHELALLITDVSMPGMSGPELAERVRAVCPDVPLLFLTGFAAGAMANRLPPGARLLEKPFTRQDLLDAVAEARAGDPRA